MKVLMFGWEFPPFKSGGLGTACYGLTRSMNKQGIDVTFVVPRAPSTDADYVNLVSAKHVELSEDIKARTNIQHINSTLVPYISSDQYLEHIRNVKKMNLNKGSGGGDPAADMYGQDLFEEVHNYAEKGELIALNEEFDMIHAHDWMTYMAGKKAKQATGKPLVVHIHATEFDRTGGNPNQDVYNIEREGLHEADRIIAVSELTKNTVITHYGIDPSKIEVVHNGVEQDEKNISVDADFGDDKIVLFLGRITIQKGPEYFLHSAKQVLEHVPNVKFIMAGSGDMQTRMIDLATDLGISSKVLFTGFLKGDDIDKAYRMANLYVMPSVSEPFGITPLESMKNGTPTLISKTSGVSEVVTNALKVDFWDVAEMTNKIVSVLKYQELEETLAENGSEEVTGITWDKAATKCIGTYSRVLKTYR